MIPPEEFVRILAEEKYLGSTQAQRLIARDCRQRLGTEYRPTVHMLGEMSAATVQARLPGILDAYEAKLDQQRVAAGILYSNDALVRGAISAASAIASPTGVPAIALKAVSFVLNKTMDAAEQQFEEHARREAQVILGHQLKVHADANHDPDLASLKGKSEKEIHRILEQTSPLFDPALSAVDPRDRDLVHGFQMQVLQQTVVSGHVQLLNLAVMEDKKLDAARKQLVGVATALRQFSEQTNESLNGIKNTQQEILDGLGEVKTQLQSQGQALGETRRDLRFIQNYLFGKMSTSEQLAALRAGMRSDLSPTEQQGLKRRLELVEKQKKLAADVQTYLNGGAALVKLAGQLGVDAKTVAAAGNVVQVGQSAYTAATALASGNFLQAAGTIVGLLTGDANPEDQRHQQILDKLNAIDQKLDVIQQHTTKILELEIKILKGMDAIYGKVQELAQSVAQFHAEEMQKLDELQEDVLFNRRLIMDGMGIGDCGSFLEDRPHFGFCNGTFPSYDAMRKHFSAYSSYYWNARKTLEGLFSLDGPVHSSLWTQAIEGRNDIEEAPGQVRRWRERVYEKSWALLVKYAKLWTEDTEAFLSMFLLPARSIESLTPEPKIDNLCNVLRFKAHMFVHLKNPLAPATLFRCIGYLLEIDPYDELVGAQGSGSLYSISELVDNRDIPRPMLLLRNALTITEIAIAQQAMLTGHLLLPLIDKCYAEAARPPDPAHPPRIAADQFRQDVEGLFANQPLLARNWLLYKVAADLRERQVNYFTYEFAARLHQDGFLRQILAFPWEFVPPQASADNRWGVKLGGSTYPLPTWRELVAGLIQYTADCEELVRLRFRIIGQLADSAFLVGDEEEETRRVFQRMLLLAA